MAQVSTAQIEAHMPVVRRLAGGAVRRLPASIEKDDLLQAGRIAAWRAIERWDGRGRLDAYVGQRVSWAIVDFLRSTHPAGRNGPPVLLVSYDELVRNDDLYDIPDDRPGPDELLERQQIWEAALRAMSPRCLDVVERLIDGQSGAQIAAHLGVSESRVSQLLAEAVAAGKS